MDLLLTGLVCAIVLLRVFLFHLANIAYLVTLDVVFSTVKGSISTSVSFSFFCSPSPLLSTGSETRRSLVLTRIHSQLIGCGGGMA